jgi:integrase
MPVPPKSVQKTVQKVALTDLAVRSLPTGYHFDAKLPSFGIRVGKTRKTWVVIRGTNRTKVTLGYYPALSLAEARKKAFAAFADQHQTKPITPTFPKALELFLANRSKTLRPGSLKQLSWDLKKHFHWQKRLDEITHHDVRKIIDALPTESQRYQATKDIRTFFNWTVPQYLSNSPCTGLKASKPRSRERTLTDEELAKVWKKADEIGYPYGTIIKLLILTGQRIGEISSMQWDWIGENLTIPADIAKNGRTSIIPLGNMARDAISHIPRYSNHLFPARNKTDQHMVSFWSNKQILDECGVKNFTHHDLRRTFATNMAKLGVRLEVTEKILNHISGSTGGIVSVYMKYNFIPEMMSAVELYEQHLLSLLAKD